MLTAHEWHEMHVNLPPAMHSSVSTASPRLSTASMRETHRTRAASSGVKLIFLPAVSSAATSTSFAATVGLYPMTEPSVSSFLSTEVVELEAMFARLSYPRDEPVAERDEGGREGLS